MPVEPGRFHNLAEFRSLQDWLADNSGWEQVPVTKPLTNVGLRESWYRCASDGTTWRLIEPDPPYPGVWEQVAIGAGGAS